MTKSIKPTVRRSECPISFGLDLFGDKWTLLILRDILFLNKARFSDFAVHENIASNILSDRLDRLEKTEVITKERDTTLKNQNTYRATDKGRELLPILIEMMAWGLLHDAQTPASKTFVNRLAKERKEIVEEIFRAINHGTFEEYSENEMGINSLYAGLAPTAR